MDARAHTDPLRAPMSIYEVHLGSWRLNPLEGNRSLTYHELADELAAYAVDLGFTHVELLPVMAHPFTGSWGYQVTCYYAPTPRFGSPDDFRDFVDRLHEHGIGVILDWVPAHFPRDDWALARFDGTALYEHADPRAGRPSRLGDARLQLRPPRGAQLPARQRAVLAARVPRRRPPRRRRRVDALPRLLAPAPASGCPTSSAAARISTRSRSCKELNEVIHGREPGHHHRRRGVDRLAGRLASDLPRRPGLRLQVEHGLDARHARLLLAATRSTAATTTTSSPSACSTRSARTSSCRSATTRSCTARARCISKMPGDRWQQFANLRALYGYMWAHPGKKLLFMGQEFAQEAEWSHERSLDWHLLERRDHAAIQSLVRDLNQHLPGRARTVGARTSLRRGSGGSSPTMPTATCSRSSAPRAEASACWCASATTRRSCARATASGSRAAGAGARRSTPTRAATAAANVGNGGSVPAQESPGTANRIRRAHASAARRVFLVPEAQ